MMDGEAVYGGIYLQLPETLETKRLVFRKLHPDDLELIYRQFSDPEMCRFFSEPPCTREEAEEIIVHYQTTGDKGYYRYAMFNKNSGQFIGTCGYHYWDQELHQVEIGYDIWKEHWRQGYMAEAMPELISICFDHLGVNCIYILTDPSNVASIGAARMFGFAEADPCRDITDNVLCMKLLRPEKN